MTNFVAENRLGIFSIDRDFIYAYPEIVAKALSGMIIVRAEADFAADKVEYKAFSPAFAPLERGWVPLHYRLRVTGDAWEWEVG